MNNVKSFNEFINDKSIPSIDEVLKDSITEDSKRIHPSDTNPGRVIWIGPYDKTGHYLRIKNQDSTLKRKS